MVILCTTLMAHSASTPRVKWSTSPSHVPFRPCRRLCKVCQRVITLTLCLNRFVSSAKPWLALCVVEWTSARAEFTLVGLHKATFATYKTHDDWYSSLVAPQCTAVWRFDPWWSNCYLCQFRLKTPQTLLTAPHTSHELMWCSLSPNLVKRPMC